MSSGHARAVFVTLALYALLALSCVGWGRWAEKLITRKHASPNSIPSTLRMWLGWATLLLVLQLIHLKAPLNAYTVSPVFAAGILMSLAFLRRPSGRPSLHMRSASKWIIVSLLASPVVFWVASRAMLPPVNYDSGLYHFQTIRWINTFPIVPGLGSLHGRLAFNQSMFAYVAALNLPPFFGHGRAIANSFLFLLASAMLIQQLAPILRRRRLPWEVSPLKWAPAAFAFPILPYLAMSTNGLASPKPDFASGMLQVVLLVSLASALVDQLEDDRRWASVAPVLAVLATTAITLKLSNLGFAAAILVFTTLYTWKRSPERARDLARLAFPSMLILAVWTGRGIILSGAPLYPSTLGYIPTSWSVPIELIQDEANWIYSWARQPGVHWSQVLGQWEWVRPWFSSILRWDTVVVYPMAVWLGLVMVITLASRWARRYARPIEAVSWLFMLPPLASVSFWLLTAPDPRFARATFLLMPVSASVTLLCVARSLVNRRTLIVIACGLFLVTNLKLLQYAYEDRWTLTYISTTGWHEIPRVPLRKMVTASGLRVYVPIEGDQCWDASLPCTPYFDRSLSLRSPDSMDSGFVLRRDDSPLDTTAKKP